MKITISNIAWQKENDDLMYAFLNKNNINGIEIAPTRIFTEKPYKDLTLAKSFRDHLEKKYFLDVVSLQSICFGKNEVIFGNNTERTILKNHIQNAIDFAEVLGCKNLVFGSPKNRIISENQEDIAYNFFYEIGEYAKTKNTFLAIEPNPAIYGTNFLNTTHETFEFIKEVNSNGLKVNVDLGTIIENKEDIDILKSNFHHINHIHISEPYLEKIEIKEIHLSLKKLLIENNYQNFISIEMKSGLSILEIQDLFIKIKNVYNS